MAVEEIHDHTVFTLTMWIHSELKSSEKTIWEK